MSDYVGEYRRALLPDGCEYCGLSLVACHAAWHVDGDIGCCASCTGDQSHD